ncbi:Mu-like prophage major head subunit gpT family protein [Chromobacterium subtsugae]|uniref:Mu-like prophage major head subunit gpT family protein n=1 Tax=Chromobacterium subtsugae TaxID=251747 RepID=UPI000640C1F7|nr:Mu-like prophage major head subunit gpT family protein [Chromobacterium subtsugae]
MLVNAENVQAIFWALRTEFNNAFGAAPTVWDQMATRVPSTGKQNIYAWLENFPRMRQWIGEKQAKALAAHGYTIVNNSFEATVEVDRDDIEDDQLGIYAPQAQNAGVSAKQLPDEIVIDLLNNAFVNPCYDGQPFFAQGHVVRGLPVSNLSNLPLTIAGQAAAMKTYGVVRTNMRKTTDEDGRPLNITPNLLVVPPALEDIANALMTNERLNDGMANPYRNTATVLCDARLTSDTAWFLLDTRKPIKPLIYQERKQPEFVQQVTPESDNVFMRKKFRFGAEARAAGGYGFWQMAAGSTGAGQIPQ